MDKEKKDGKSEKSQREYDAWVERIAEAVTGARKDVVRLVERLDAFERTGIWRIKHQSFARFLRERFSLGGEWYANMKDAVAKLGPERTIRLGASVAKIVAKLPKNQIDRAIRAILADTPDGATPREARARRIVWDLLPAPARQHSAITEVDRLRARIRELEEENVRLRAELRALKQITYPVHHGTAKQTASPA